MTSYDAAQKWNAIAPRTRQKLVTQHYNGNCCCYGERGAIIPGSRETGKDCLVGSLDGQEWREAQRLIPHT